MTDTAEILARVQALAEHARKVSPSGRMNVALADLEAALSDPTTDPTTSGPVVSVVAYAAAVAERDALSAWLDGVLARLASARAERDALSAVIDNVSAALAGDVQAVLKVASAQQIIIDAGSAAGLAAPVGETPTAPNLWRCAPCGYSEANQNPLGCCGEPVGETPDERTPACVANWPGCYVGGYDPRCCRFPKSCSCWKPGPALPVEETQR